MPSRDSGVHRRVRGWDGPEGPAIPIMHTLLCACRTHLAASVEGELLSETIQALARGGGGGQEGDTHQGNHLGGEGITLGDCRGSVHIPLASAKGIDFGQKDAVMAMMHRLPHSPALQN